MKSLIILFSALLFVQTMYAQDVTGSSVSGVVYDSYAWDPDTDFPLGWTAYGLDLYTTGNQAANSGKFDHQYDSLVIAANEHVVNIAYSLKGNSLKTPYAFTVYESEDGEHYSVLSAHNDTTASITTKYNTFAVVPQNTSRYFKFSYDLRSGGNIAIDDVFLYADTPTSLQMKNKPIYTILNEGGYIEIDNTADVTFVYLFDITGKQVSMQKGNKNNQMQINTVGLMQGIYLLYIDNGYMPQTIKFVK